VHCKGETPELCGVKVLKLASTVGLSYGMPLLAYYNYHPPPPPSLSWLASRHPDSMNSRLAINVLIASTHCVLYVGCLHLREHVQL